MTPQENLTRRRADFHRAIDIILDHLSTGDVAELTSSLKDPVFLLPSEEVSIETQHSAIDDIIGRAPSDEQAAAMARHLMLEGLSLPTFYYIKALQEAVPVIDKEIGEAYRSEAREVTFALPFFTKTVSNYSLRKRQGRSSE